MTGISIEVRNRAGRTFKIAKGDRFELQHLDDPACSPVCRGSARHPSSTAILDYWTKRVLPGTELPRSHLRILRSVINVSYPVVEVIAINTNTRRVAAGANDISICKHTKLIKDHPADHWREASNLRS